MFQKGFIRPEEFVDIFGDWDKSAEVVYKGNLNEEFIQSVRHSALEKPLNEGVICKGSSDKIQFKNTGTLTKAVVLGATDLDSALKLASAAIANDSKTWFQYAGNTYIVDNVDGTADIQATDVIVKLNGLVDLSNSSLGTTDTLTIA